MTTRHQQALRDNALAEVESWDRNTVMNMSTITALQRFGILLETPPTCTHCSRQMVLRHTTNTSDNVEWVCASRPKQHHLSVRTGTWLADKKKPLVLYFSIIRLLQNKAPHVLIAEELQVSVKLVRRVWLSLVRRMNDVLELSLFNVNYVFTKGMEVEIDEAYMWWTGEEYQIEWEDVTEQQGGKWVVGIIDRGRTRLYLYCVEGRTVEDMIEVIEDVVEPGTLIYTDAVNTYDALDENYRHYVINKKKEGFSKWISPPSVGWIDVCVNKIEETWKDLRSLSHRRMLNRPANIPMLCIEFMYRWHELNWYDLIKV